MVALSEKVQDTSVADEGATKKVNALAVFDLKNVNGRFVLKGIFVCFYSNKGSCDR